MSLSPHNPILCAEIVEMLDIKPADVVIDGTVGFGGHSQAFLEKLSSAGILIGLDLDEKAVQYCQDKFEGNKNARIFKSNYIDFPEILSRLKIKTIDRALVDLGLSSYQIDSSERGFTYLKEEVLDMRMNLDSELTAEMVVNEYENDELYKVFREYGEIGNPKKFVENIDIARKSKKIRTTIELINIMKKSFFFRNKRKVFLKTCAQVFQALRIEVNGELDNLKLFLSQLEQYISPEGKVAIISFHSLEDRIVKNYIKENICQKQSKYNPEKQIGFCIRPLNKKVVVATQAEIRSNSRAKCAKLRVFSINK
jgi:16S rRNA (cytosine1402-N4)-methyltransferase